MEHGEWDETTGRRVNLNVAVGNTAVGSGALQDMGKVVRALTEAALAIEREADAYEAQMPGNPATGPMYEAARIVRQHAHEASTGTRSR